MPILVIFILAVGLSMDAFSLALIYGTLNLNIKIEKLTAILVGVFHFFMPILGCYIGKIILSIIMIDPNIIVGMIFLILGLEMIISLKKEESVKVLNSLFSIILFSFTVSIDSFSTGIAFGATKTNIFLSALVFSITSFIFTYLGLIFGKKLSTRFGDITNCLGALILLILGIKYLL